MKHGYLATILHDLGKIIKLLFKILTRYTCQIKARETVVYQNLGSKILSRLVAWIMKNQERSWQMMFLLF